MNDSQRRYSPLDEAIAHLQRALGATLGPAPPDARGYPAAAVEGASLDEAGRRHAAGLMRINHAGEVCAQALYLGQAAIARKPAIRAHLLEAADEEASHLAWCAKRLDELGSGPSVLNPLWFAGSFAIGAAAALVGDRESLGFVVETERQVEAHLGDHLERLPAGDERSRAVVRTMQADEARHGEEAKDAGARELPQPVPRLMALAAGVMKFLAYRV
ncbi:MAG TPA: 2-polyprenyl-3-methyl-6-methoxy-1,4-benzoquinone monooxygenase [Xanthomonadales bacterium]|nr:2-polyprenyl-3-methyl-6-methoxy-1,4-benzoquinone monooxygenase [Xanthomonadales bacterium]